MEKTEYKDFSDGNTFGITSSILALKPEEVRIALGNVLVNPGMQHTSRTLSRIMAYANECFVEAIFMIPEATGVHNRVVSVEDSEGLHDFLVILRHVDFVEPANAFPYQVGRSRLAVQCTSLSELKDLIAATHEHPVVDVLGADPGYTHKEPIARFVLEVSYRTNLTNPDMAHYSEAIAIVTSNPDIARHDPEDVSFFIEVAINKGLFTHVPLEVTDVILSRMATE